MSIHQNSPILRPCEMVLIYQKKTKAQSLPSNDMHAYAHAVSLAHL